MVQTKQPFFRTYRLCAYLFMGFGLFLAIQYTCLAIVSNAPHAIFDDSWNLIDTSQLLKITCEAILSTIAAVAMFRQKRWAMFFAAGIAAEMAIKNSDRALAIFAPDPFQTARMPTREAWLVTVLCATAASILFFAFGASRKAQFQSLDRFDATMSDAGGPLNYATVSTYQSPATAAALGLLFQSAITLAAAAYIRWEFWARPAFFGIVFVIQLVPDGLSILFSIYLAASLLRRRQDILPMAIGFILARAGGLLALALLVYGPAKVTWRFIPFFGARDFLQYIPIPLQLLSCLIAATLLLIRAHRTRAKFA